jgi:hypothetical protein
MESARCAGVRAAAQRTSHHDLGARVEAAEGRLEMSNIGVVVLDWVDTQPLKRAALWFDQLAVLDRSLFHGKNEPPGQRDAMRADLAFLKEKKLICSLEEKWYEDPLGDDPEAQALEEERSSILSFAPFATLPTPAQRRTQLRLLWAGEARLASMWLRRARGLDAVPILSSFSEIEVREASRRVQVVRLILKELPTPSGITPWERILDFRQDDDAMRTCLRLRNWANEIAKKDYTASEIEDKLRYLLHEYRKEARKHITESIRGLAQAVVVTTGELAENLSKLRFGQMAKALFSIRPVPLTLLQADPDVPGKDVAYIVGAQEKFAE